MAIPRAQQGEQITAQKWNQLGESSATGFAPSGVAQDFGQMNHNIGNPSFWCYISMQPPYPVRVMPGWICVEGGTPFLPSGMDPDEGMTLPHGSNAYLNLYTRRSGDISADPGNASQGSGEGVEATATVTAEPLGPMDGWTYTPIMLAEWKRHYSVYHPKQHWASDIFITSGGSIFGADIPVFVRSCPETGWGPDENRAHNGLEVKDESTPDKWQYAVALKHANESYSTEDIVPVDYQLGGVYKSYISGLDGAVAAQNKPTISYGQIIFPLANQGDTYLPSTYGLIYAARLVVDPESYSGSTYNEPRINKGVVEIPKGAGLEIGSENDPDRPPAYHYMTDAQLQTNGWIKVCSYGFNTGSETHDCYMAIRKGKLFFYMKPDGQISTEPS